MGMCGCAHVCACVCTVTCLLGLPVPAVFLSSHTQKGRWYWNNTVMEIFHGHVAYSFWCELKSCVKRLCKVHGISKDTHTQKKQFWNSATVLSCWTKNYMCSNKFYNKWLVFIYGCPLQILSIQEKNKIGKIKNCSNIPNNIFFEMFVIHLLWRTMNKIFWWYILFR